jgi:hypothetical protein
MKRSASARMARWALSAASAPGLHRLQCAGRAMASLRARDGAAPVRGEVVTSSDPPSRAARASACRPRSPRRLGVEPVGRACSAHQHPDPRPRQTREGVAPARQLARIERGGRQWRQQEGKDVCGLRQPVLRRRDDEVEPGKRRPWAADLNQLGGASRLRPDPARHRHAAPPHADDEIGPWGPEPIARLGGQAAQRRPEQQIGRPVVAVVGKRLGHDLAAHRLGHRMAHGKRLGIVAGALPKQHPDAWLAVASVHPSGIRDCKAS